MLSVAHSNPVNKVSIMNQEYKKPPEIFTLVESFDPSTMSVETQEKKQDNTITRSNHWEVRTQEQPYAFLSDKETAIENRYGKRIDLVELTNFPKERSLFINENPEVGSNPNRNKQHGFFFTADNCIGCHACEAACSEKNENPAHLAFRSVGYVEGGSYPDYKRMNISMACNHCDDPVCLKGCPTGAYTKHAEYGAVLQDPDTCFGCGYCTWVCPYNAPQLDPVKGQVSKCNMCVDRLEVGLKPACVSACVGNALDFGVIENTPENREQCKTSIPGFPDPEITHPNIRFQQTKSLPDEMSRTDSMPVKYQKDKQGNYSPVIDQKAGKEKQWNLSKLNSRENPLVLFTLFAQAALGTFAVLFTGALMAFESLTSFFHSDMYLPAIILSLVMMAFALLMSVTHLGKPLRFYRGFNNLKYSPMAREGFGLSLFCIGSSLTALFSIPENEWLSSMILDILSINLAKLSINFPINTIQYSAGVFTLISGMFGLFYMNKCYQIKARPFWHHLQTAASFVGNTLSLGATVAAILVLTTMMIQEGTSSAITQAMLIFSGVFIFGLILEAVGLVRHNTDMNRLDNEGGASHYIQCTTFGRTYHLRNLLLGTNIVFSIGLFLYAINHEASFIIIVLLALSASINIITALIGRALFYILVIPTTMPGAFFWKNKGFEQHARDIGLADNPATGVAPLCH